MKRRPRERVMRGRRTPASEVGPSSGLREFVIYLAKGLVDDPSAVQVTEQRREHGSLFELRVAPGDLGNVIGRNGRTAQALRTLLGLRAARTGEAVELDIVD
jgi:predicted RNA-binding protein YlqC (UPF0109 family)